jgi:hypothetical protein
MSNALCADRLAENLGSMPEARFLGNYIGIRVTRTHLLATGQHVDLSTLAEQAGFRIHVFFRREAFECLTKYLRQFTGSSNDLSEALNSLREAVMRAPLRDCPVLFQVGDFTLIARFGSVDHDDPRRAITVALASPAED